MFVPTGELETCFLTAKEKNSTLRIQSLVKTQKNRLSWKISSLKLRIFPFVSQRKVSLTQEQDFDNLRTQNKAEGVPERAAGVLRAQKLNRNRRTHAGNKLMVARGEGVGW